MPVAFPVAARARRQYADAVEARGPAYRNAADSIRAGFSNMWIEAGIAALATVLSTVPDEDEDE